MSQRVQTTLFVLFMGQLSACAVSGGHALEAKTGYVVVKATQMPVYTFYQDRPGISRCTASCLRFFKPVEVAEARGDDLAFKRPDGIHQAQYLGRPLYTSVLDTPGDPPKAHRIHDGWMFLGSL